MLLIFLIPLIRFQTMIFASFVGIAVTLVVKRTYNGKKMSHLLKMNPNCFFPDSAGI